MRYIKLFLASSVVEFQAQRRDLGDFIRSLNDVCVKRGIYFDLTVCEDLSNAVAMDRKQASYNQSIRESQYFYVLFGHTVGAYTAEEFDVAMDQFRLSGAPKIYTYFLTLPEGESPDETVIRFMSRLDRELGHYYATFTHLDSIKLNILLELIRDETVRGALRFEDGQALVDSQPILALSQVPIYNQNEAVQSLLTEKARLDRDFAEQAAVYSQNPTEEQLNALTRLSDRRGRLTEQLHQAETDVFDLCCCAADRRSSGQPMDRRERQALRLLEQGDYGGARAILENPRWEQEIAREQELEHPNKDRIRAYISAKRTLIHILQTDAKQPETTQKIETLYARLVPLAQQHQVETDTVYECASFLRGQSDTRSDTAITAQLELWRGAAQEPAIPVPPPGQTIPEREVSAEKPDRKTAGIRRLLTKLRIWRAIALLLAVLCLVLAACLVVPRIASLNPTGQWNTAAGRASMVGNPFLYSEEAYASDNSPYAFGTEYRRDRVRSITFLDSLTLAPQDSYDISDVGDGSVLLWGEVSGDTCDLYIGANGGVKAPKDCSGLFCDYPNLETITFGDNFDTSDVTTMTRMFQSCSKLQSMDLRSWDTSSVRVLSDIFSGCSDLKIIDVRTWPQTEIERFQPEFPEGITLLR